jgi:thiamine-phosphate pyrophosphorylase
MDPVGFARAVLVARPAALQLRAKDLADHEMLALLRAIVPLCRAAAVPMIANDRPHLAVAAGCDGVHVGQEDASAEEVRRLAPGLGVGVSTHTAAQLGDALAARPDYVAYGPVFTTASKAKPDPCVGLDGLARAFAQASDAGVKLVAIGGITLDRAPDVRSRAHAAAVIHALIPSRGGGYDEVTARAAAIHDALGGERIAPELPRA